MFKNKFLSTVLMSLCMVLCVAFFSTLTVEAANGTLQMGEDGKFYYYEGDEWIKDKYGYVDFDGSKFLVANGVVADYMNGLAQDPDNEADWYFLSNGLAQTQYTGLVEYDGAWFYVSEGKSDTTINDYVEYDGGLFLVALGRIVKEHQGLAQDPNGDDWYFVADGQAQIQYSGLAEYDKEWFYIEAGKLQEDISGIVKYDGSYFRIADGMMKEQVFAEKMTLNSQITKEYGENHKLLEYNVMEYDENGNLKVYTFYNADGSKTNRYLYTENGMSYQYKYDENGKEILEEYYLYNEKSNTVEEYYYKDDGNLKYYVVSTLNSDGNAEKTEYIYVDPDYSSINKETYIYEYDKTGKKVKSYYYVDDAKEYSKWETFEYDSRGNLTRLVRYYNTGEVELEALYEYDSNNNIIDEKLIVKGMFYSYWYKYEYDANGNCIKHSTYMGTIFDSEIKFNSFVYKYDKDGNRVESVWYDANGDAYDKTIYEYDSEGNILKETMYGKEGNVKSYTTYTYLYQ